MAEQVVVAYLNALDADREDLKSGTLERDFEREVVGFSSVAGISYAAWREVGVPRRVLDRAGLLPGTSFASRASSTT